MIKQLKHFFGYSHKPEKHRFDNLHIHDYIQLDKNGLPLFWSLNFDLLNGHHPSAQELLNEGYLNPYFFIVINRLAEVSARLERIYVDISDPSREPTGMENVTQLLTKPNKRDYCEDFLYRIYASYMATGEAFVVGIEVDDVLQEISGKKYSSLFVPSPRYVTVNEDAFGMPESYDISYHDMHFTLGVEQVLHITKPDITRDSDRGLSNLTPNRYPYKSNNEIWKSEYWLHKNKGVNGMLTNEGKRAMTPKEKEAMQRQFDNETQNENFSKVKVTSESVKFIQMGTNPNDLKSIEARLDHLRQACATFNVDSKLFNDPGATTYNNVQEAKIAMYTDSVLPMCRKIDTELSYWLINLNYGIENIVWKVDRESIPALNKPDREYSNKIVNEFKAGLIPLELARHLIYPDYYEQPSEEELIAQAGQPQQEESAAEDDS